MKGMTTFQLVLTGVFAVFILVGVAFFALFRGGGSSGTVSNVTVWGFIPSSQFTSLLDVTGVADNDSLRVTYIEARPETFDQDFIEALASDKSPDLIMLPMDSLIRHRNKLFPIPYTSYPERTFIDNFIEEGRLFLSDDGVLALPYLVDPLVMYWNRTMFSNAGLTVPPKYWSEFFNLTKIFVEKDPAFNITQSAIAFGEYQNVTNAKEILSALIMQAGSPVTARTGKTIRSALGDTFSQPVVPAEAVVNYYTEFSNPVKSFYSWNRSLPESKDYFISGDLAVYFGFASELDSINAKNPNLNFDVAVIPQSEGGAETITYGKMIGLAIPRAAKSPTGALILANILTGPDAIQELSLMVGLPPVRNDLLKARPSDQFLAIFYDSTVWSRAWLDPDKKETDNIFKKMVEDITSGRKRVSASVQDASSSLQKLLSNVSI